jgi:hypothetical protein
MEYLNLSDYAKEKKISRQLLFHLIKQGYVPVSKLMVISGRIVGIDPEFVIPKRHIGRPTHGNK